MDRKAKLASQHGYTSLIPVYEIFLVYKNIKCEKCGEIIAEPKELIRIVRHMDRLKLYIYILSTVVIVAVIWVMFFLKIAVSDQVIPTLINGITSSLSVIIGFSGAFIGIMFREIGKNDHKARAFYLTAIILLFVPLTMLWTTYCFLTMNMLEFAVKYGLVGLIFTLYLFFVVVIDTVKILDAEAKKK